MILKQSTVVDILIGPFVDITDGATAETGESPTVKLSKNGQPLVAKSDVTTPIHDGDGYYNCEFDGTDTGTVGTLVVTIAATAAALPVRHEFQVVEEDAYEFLYATGSTPDANIASILASTAGLTFTLASHVDANMLAISGDTTAADNLEEGATALVATSVNDASASTTAFVAALTETTDDHYNGRIITFTSGDLKGQSTDITDYVGSSKTVTVTQLTEAPANSVTFVIS